jgi:hypothetical protein
MTGPACENVRSFDSDLGIGVAREEGFGDPGQNDYETMHPDRSNPALANLNLNDQLVGMHGHPDRIDDTGYHQSRRGGGYDPDALF